MARHLVSRRTLDSPPTRTGRRPTSHRRAESISIGGIYHGTEGGRATIRIIPSPGGVDRRSFISINGQTARKIKRAHASLPHSIKYETDSDTYERQAGVLIKEHAPELLAAIYYARDMGSVLLQIDGLPASTFLPTTPIDGIICEDTLNTYIFNLVAPLTVGYALGGFAYESENGGRLLRAVAPVADHAMKASSQGFAADLGWHQDNANRLISGTNDCHDRNRGPMNPYQAFVCVRPELATPMEVLSLGDILSQISRTFTASIIDELQMPHFAINKPESHGGGPDVENVPLLVRDQNGCFHSRFHASNISGMTPSACEAVFTFRRVAETTPYIMRVNSAPGSVLMYSNTRGMHRRRSFNARLDGRDRFYIRTYYMAYEELSELTGGPELRVLR